MYFSEIENSLAFQYLSSWCYTTYLVYIRGGRSLINSLILGQFFILQFDWVPRGWSLSV
jgi:hypothetical protein